MSEYLTEDLPKKDQKPSCDAVTVNPGQNVKMTVQRTAKGIEVSGESADAEVQEEGTQAKPQLLTEG